MIEGDTFSDCRSILWTDGALRDSAQLLRRFHDTTAGTELAGNAEVVCHNDFGPAVWKFLNLGVLPVPAEVESGLAQRRADRDV